MASEAELADLFITLRAVNAPILDAFAKTAAAGEDMVTALNAGFAEIDEAIARTAEGLVALRDEMASVASSTAGIGAEAAGGAAVAGAGASEAAGGAAAAGASAAPVDAELAAERAEMEATASQEAELEAQIQAGYAAISARFAEIATGADEAAQAWAADFAKMAQDTIALSDAMDATAVRVDAAWADMAEAETAYDAKQAATTAAAGTTLSNFSGSMLKVGAAGAIAAGAVVDMAAKFQSSTTRLVTSGGELQSNLQSDQQGILALSGQVGYSADDLSAAMYKITSAGQQGGQALNTLKAAAQGAKTENADLTTVADAVSTAMIDYKGKIGSAADVTSQLVAATSQGKTNFQDLAGAMSAILPKASAAHINFSEILGDLASMTQHGISAQQAAENLADAISHMQNPTAVMSKELAALGLNSTQLSQNLGTKGLSGTLGEVSAAVQKDMGGQQTAVVLNLQKALQGLPPSVQQLSQEVINGSASWTDWNTATKDLTVTQRSQAQSFATLYNGMHTIGTEQMTGGQVMQTYAGAMAKATGDSASLNVALMLTGQNSGNTTKAINTISSATADAQGNVRGWSDIQGTFNQKLDEAKDGLEAAAIAVGTKLLPPLTAIIGKIATFTTWLASNKIAAIALASTIGVLLAGGVIGLAIKVGTLGVSLAGNLIKPITGAVGLVKNFAGGLSGAESAAGTFGGKLASVATTIGGWASSLGTAIAAGWTWVTATVSQFVTASAAAVSNAAKSSAAWLASSAKMVGQGIAQVVTWAAAAVGQFVRVASGAVVSAASATAAWFAATAKMVAEGVAQAVTWAVGMVAKFTLVAGSAVVEAAITVAAWIAANAAMIIATGGIILLLGLIVAAAIYLATHWSQIWAGIKQVAEDVGKAVVNAWNDVMNFFHGLPAWFKGLFQDAASWLENVGGDIIHGLWNGIQNAATWLWNQIKSMVNGIVNEFKSALSIFSPSRVMADEVGQHIPLGIAMGITNAIPALASAAKKAAAAALTGAQSALGGGVTGAVSMPAIAGLGAGGGSAMAPVPSAGGAGVTVVNMPITVNGSVMTDSTITGAVQKAILQLSGRNVSFGTNVAFS